MAAVPKDIGAGMFWPRRAKLVEEHAPAFGRLIKVDRFITDWTTHVVQTLGPGP